MSEGKGEMPREWIIEQDQIQTGECHFEGVQVARGDYVYNEKVIVIEKSAYDQLQSENERLKSELNQKIYEKDKSTHDHVKQNSILSGENERLKKRCEKYRKLIEGSCEYDESCGIDKIPKSEGFPEQDRYYLFKKALKETE